MTCPHAQNLWFITGSQTDFFCHSTVSLQLTVLKCFCKYLAMGHNLPTCVPMLTMSLNSFDVYNDVVRRSCIWKTAVVQVWMKQNCVRIWFNKIITYLIRKLVHSFKIEDGMPLQFMFFFSLPTHARYRLRGSPSWLWPKCNRLLRLECP
jgi:hypothetical protein